MKIRGYTRSERTQEIKRLNDLAEAIRRSPLLCEKCGKEVPLTRMMAKFCGECREQKGAHNRKFDPKNDHLIGTDTDAKVAKMIGTTVATVGHRRRFLGIAAKGKHRHVDWSMVAWEMSNAEIARQIGCTKENVLYMRKKHTK